MYCDGSSWIPVADGLRRRGLTVHTGEERTLGDTDRERSRHATGNDWELLTFDDDVPSLVEGESLEHAGPIDARRT